MFYIAIILLLSAMVILYFTVNAVVKDYRKMTYTSPSLNLPPLPSLEPLPPLPPLPPLSFTNSGTVKYTYTYTNLSNNSTTIEDSKRDMLLALLELNAPPSMYIKHYAKHIDEDQYWKRDFLAFCKKNDIGIGETELETSMMLL